MSNSSSGKMSRIAVKHSLNTLFVCATIFQFTWDLTMDWGMLLKSTSKSASDSSFLGISLRRSRLFGPSWLYITVIVANFFLRFAWALTLLPDNRSNGPKTFYTTILFHLTPLVAAVEVRTVCSVCTWFYLLYVGSMIRFGGTNWWSAVWNTILLI